MAEVIASFACTGHRSTLHVVRGDALTIPADVAIIGRAPEVRRQLERAGAVFNPYKERCSVGHMRGRVIRAAVPAGSANWGRVFAISYRAPHNRVEFGPPLYGVGSHPGMLAFSLSALLDQAVQEAPVRRCLFLPLSWRNPDVVCAATVAACFGFAAVAEKYCLPGGCEFVLCDREAPAPFLRYLRNEGDCMARFMGTTMIAASRYYRENPIREIPAVALDW